MLKKISLLMVVFSLVFSGIFAFTFHVEEGTLAYVLENGEIMIGEDEKKVEIDHPYECFCWGGFVYGATVGSCWHEEP